MSNDNISTNAMKIGALYARKSVESNVEHGSPEQQTHMCLDLAKELTAKTGIQHKIKYILVEDGGTSAGTINRPKYQQLLTLIREKRIDFICAKEISRLSRSTKDFADLIDRCVENKIDMHIRGLGIQPTDPIGRMIFHQMGAFSEMERKITIQRIKDSSRSATLKNAKLNGGRLPKGLDLTKRAGFPSPNREQLAEVVKLMNIFVETGSLKSTLDEANRLHIKNRDGKAFNYNTLRSLLTNRLLIGKKLVVHGLKDELVTDVSLPHGPLVPLDLFESVQRGLAAGRRLSNRKSRRVYLLSGLLFAQDGTRFSTQSGTSNSKKTLYYYRNQKNQLRVNAVDLEGELFNYLRRCFESNDQLEAIVKTLQATKADQSEFLLKQITTLKRDLGALTNRDSDILEHLHRSASALGSEASLRWLEEQIKHNKDKAADLTQKIDNLSRDYARICGAVVADKVVKRSLTALFDRLVSVSSERQRCFLRKVINRIVIDEGNRATISWSLPLLSSESSAALGPQDGSLTEIGSTEFTLHAEVKVRSSPLYANGEFLREAYIDRKLTVSKLAAAALASKKTILKYLRIHGIPVRTSDTQRNPKYGQKKRHGSIGVDALAISTIRELRWLRSQGVSYQRIAMQLNARGWTPSKSTIWHAASVRKIFLANSLSVVENGSETQAQLL